MGSGTGANWTFVAWGAYHALLFLPLLLLGQNRRYRDSVAENSFLPSVKELTQMGATIFAGLIGMDSVPVGRYIPSGCVSRADVQCLVILGSSACGLGIRATPAEEMFLFHGSYVRRGMDRPKTGAWV